MTELESTIHQVKHEDVVRLMNIFARLTPEGWVIPEWLDLMGRTIRLGARS